MQDTRIYSFDVLKFVGILLIALLHFQWQLCPQAYLVVELCFIITGFLISQNYEKYYNQNYMQTLTKRLLSFYPYYVIGLVFYCISLHNFKLNFIINNLFLLPEVGITEPIASGHLWFLGAYIYVFGLFLAFIKNFNKVQLNYVIGILTLVSLFALMKYSPAMNLNITLNKDYYIGILPFGVVRAVVAIGIGFMLAELKKEQNHLLLLKNKVVSTIIELFCISYIFYMIFHSVTTKFDITYYIIIATLILSLSYKNSYLSILLEYIGKKFSALWQYSMLIYIFHLFVITETKEYLINNINNKFLYILVYYILVMLFCICINKIYIFIREKISSIINVTSHLSKKFNN